MRVDVWLDVACLFKTRSLAQSACRGGKVEVNGQVARPSRLLHPGDELRISRGAGRHQIVVVRDLALRHVAGPRRAHSTRTARRRPPPKSSSHGGCGGRSACGLRRVPSTSGNGGRCAG